MTLLFSYIDDNYVMHVADERVSQRNARTRKWDVVDDNTAKQILVRGSLLVSFTGPIAIDGGTPTTNWLAQRLADSPRPIEEILDEAIAQLTVAFDRRPYHDQCLTYLLGGWAQSSHSDVLKPVYGEITNQDPNSFERQPRFGAWFGGVPSGAGWVTRGQPLKDDVELILRRRINDALTAGVSPSVLQRLFLDAMRSTAASNQLVGPSALIGVLPRAGMEYAQAHPDEFWVATNGQGAVIPGAAMFVRMPAGEDRAVPYRPVIA